MFHMTEAKAELSDDARAVAGGAFGYMRPGKGELNFRTPARIHPRMKSALDELTAAGVLNFEDLGREGYRYTPRVDCRGFAAWLMANQSKGKIPFVVAETGEAGHG
jgi:hypothetical protein